jgi:hypothetical protein
MFTVDVIEFGEGVYGSKPPQKNTIATQVQLNISIAIHMKLESFG